MSYIIVISYPTVSVYVNDDNYVFYSSLLQDIIRTQLFFQPSCRIRPQPNYVIITDLKAQHCSIPSVITIRTKNITPVTMTPSSTRYDSRKIDSVQDAC